MPKTHLKRGSTYPKARLQKKTKKKNSKDLLYQKIVFFVENKKGHTL